MSKKPITFTKHAFDRVGERLRLNPQEVIEIIKNDMYLPIGSEGNRVHKLFYSRDDGQCFVAVHDDRAHLNEIITVLPVDYHHRWEISLTAVSQAKALIMGDAVLDKKDSSAVVGEIKKDKIIFLCYFQSYETGKVKIVNFTLKINISELQEEIKKYTSGSELIKQYTPKSIWDEYILQSACYKIGKNGTPTNFEVE